jgi:hypothetical protein
MTSFVDLDRGRPGGLLGLTPAAAAPRSRPGSTGTARRGEPASRWSRWTRRRRSPRRSAEPCPGPPSRSTTGTWSGWPIRWSPRCASGWPSSSSAVAAARRTRPGRTAGSCCVGCSPPAPATMPPGGSTSSTTPAWLPTWPSPPASPRRSPPGGRTSSRSFAPASPKRRTEGCNRVIKQLKRVGCGYRNQANYARRIPCTSPPGGQCDDGQHGVATLHREEPVSRPRRRAAAGPAQPLEATVEPAGSRGQPDIASDAGAIALAMSQARPRRHEESGANAERNVDHGY